MKRYNTDQKELLVEFLRDHRNEYFTSEEIASSLPGVGKSTVYRLLSQARDEQRISTSRRGRVLTYSYLATDCEEHLHLECSSCGKRIHLSPEASKKVGQILMKEAGFRLENTPTVLIGKCEECSNAEKK